MNDTLEFPTVETVPMPVATQPAASEPGTLKATALASFVAIRSHAAKLAEKYRAVAYDVTTPKGMAAAKDARLELREEGRFAVQRLRDRLKDEANDLKRVVTDEAEKVIQIIAPVEDAIHAQITAEEERKKAEKVEAARILAERQQKQSEGVAGIRAYLSRAQTVADMTAARVAAGIKMLEGMTFSTDDWLDPVAAANAQCETVEGMRALHGTLLAREAEAARLEAQRVEQERQAAELAAAQAKLQAEQQRIARLQAMVAEIRAAGTGHENATAADLYEARTVVAALDVSEAVYAEFAALAQAAQASTLAVLDRLRGEAEARELAAVRATLAPAPAPYTPPPFAGYAGHPIYNPENPPPEFTEGQDDPQVLKAEPATADATAGSVPADTSPRVGAMGAGPAADAAPAADAVDERVAVAMEAVFAACVPQPAPSVPLPEPTMTLGEFNTYIAPLRIDGAGLETLGFPAAGRRKAAMLYHDTDKARMVAAMVKHLQGLR